jgi:tetratricopeptide (TPR) repeat protein
MSMVASAAETLDSVQALYDAGLFVSCRTAFERTFGPLEATAQQSTAAALLAGRLCGQLGAPRRSTAIMFRAYRRDRTHAGAVYFYLSSCIAPSGPWRLLNQAERLSREVALSPHDASHVLALRARATAAFRDHERALALLDEADALSPRDPWLSVERAAVLAQADRLEDGLAHAQAALVLRPNYVPALRTLSSLLSDLGRMEEAVEVLARGSAENEAGSLVWELGSLLARMERHAEAEQALERAVTLFALLEPGLKKVLRAEQADAAYMLGRLERARELALEVDTPHYRGFAERLEARCRERSAQLPSSEERVVLDVPWVRQKHMTCAPATLASIARYFGREVDHDALAAEICYGGTFSHGERGWAERSGFVVREFTLDHATAQQLLGRGVPITLTTVEPTSAHLQVLHGHDALRGTLLVRDPSSRFDVEYEASAFFARYASTGPRGMVFVPPDQVHRLAGLELPDQARHDALHALCGALEVHDRSAASRAQAELDALGGGHRLALQGRLWAANYDRDAIASKAALDGLLGLFPDAEHLALRKAEATHNLEPVAVRAALLDRFALGRSAHPATVRARAELLARDGRHGAEARFWATRAVRLCPSDPRNTNALANLSWDERRFDEALRLYRFAACSQDTSENYALSYFKATNLLGRVQEGLAFLEARVARYAARSARPVETLFEAHCLRDRHDEGFAILSRALDEEPDGLLELFAGAAYARHGQHERARALLEHARGRSPERAWLRTAARVASLVGDAPRARALHRELTELDPLDLEAQSKLAAELSESAGPEAAVAHFAGVSARFPHHFDLAVLSYRAAQRAGHTTASLFEPLLRIAPHDPWVQREWSFWLVTARRHAEGLAVAEEQVRLVPCSCCSFGTLGAALAALGRRAEAMAAHRKALALDADYTYALDSLMELCADTDERRRELEALHEELTRQSGAGQGLLAFAVYARGVLAPERLLGVLEAALRERPDLPDAHLALAREHAVHMRIDLARAVCTEACARFPYHGALWRELASVCALARDEEGRLEALTTAHRVDCEDSETVALLAEALLGRGEVAQAIQRLESAVLRDPGQVTLRIALAQARFRSGERERAFAELELLVAQHPGYDRAWSLLDSWDEEIGRPDAALAAARALTERRPDEARSWLMLVRRLALGDDLAALERAVARATALNPELVDAYDQLAYACAQQGRWAEALEACAPRALREAASEGGEKKPLPYLLRGRALWVMWRRGSVRDAIRGMEELLHEVPDYISGLRWLCDFYESAGDAQGHARAARRLVQLAPDSAPTHGYVAAALLEIGERSEAKEHLWRALALDPGYVWGALTAFDLHLADEELALAERALARIAASLPDAPATLRRTVALRAKQDLDDEALAAFAALLTAKNPDTEGVARAYAALVAAGLGRHALECCQAALCNPAAQVEALGVWVDAAADDPFDQLKAALRLELAPPGQEAVSDLLTRMTDADIPNLPKKRFFLLNRKALRKFTPIWGAAGYLLVSMNSYFVAARWLGDYAGRQGIKPWQLFNLAEALRNRGSAEKARAAHRAALALPADHSTSRHRVWAAYYAALAGAHDEAREQLDACAGEELHGQQLLTRGFAEAAIAARLLARRRAYRLIAPLRLSLNRLLEEASVDLAKQRVMRGALARLIKHIAGTRPFWQALWIRLTWGQP